MDALEGLSDEDGSSSGASSSGDSDAEQEEGDGSSAKKKQKVGDSGKATAKKAEITLDDLEAAGFSTGPSVLYMKPPAEEQQTWNWCAGYHW